MNASTYTRRTIPAGHYAVTWPGNGVVYFFRVTIGKTGKWAGVRFLSRQSSDEYLNMTPKGREAWWPLLLADVNGAAQAYGREIGRCGFCNKTLTDPVSIAYGVGPDCRKQHGIG